MFSFTSWKEKKIFELLKAPFLSVIFLYLRKWSGLVVPSFFSVMNSRDETENYKVQKQHEIELGMRRIKQKS